MTEFAQQRPRPKIDWEAFYSHYRKPGYIAGYEIINKLGGGVFGMVYKARKESIGKDYAIKFLKVDDEVVRDAVVLRELEHRRLLRADRSPQPRVDRGQGRGRRHPVHHHELCRGGHPAQAPGAGTLDPRREALRIFIQAARGVQALHEHSLVHFDLKPANIFLKRRHRRGSATTASPSWSPSRATPCRSVRGTPYYMAPEMLQAPRGQRAATSTPWA